MNTPEFSRSFDVRQLEGKQPVLTATAEECAALAQRFDLVRINELVATLLLTREDRSVIATGTLKADIVQSCAVSAEDFPVSIDETITFRFISAGTAPSEEEIELDANALDEIPYNGSEVDLGEAVAESLALAIDPYAVGPQAEEARRKAGLLGEGEAGPFAALAKLRKG